MKMLIPPDWDGQSFCRYAVCWPDSPLWKIILRGLVSEPARGFFWDERTGTVTEVLAGFRQTLDENLHLPEVIMACGDTGLQEIATSLNKIAIAMNNQVTVNAGCCSSGQGTGGQGGVAPPYNPTDEGDPETTPPPDGFDSWEQFFANKCAVATDIVKTLRGDINRWGTINWIGITIAGALPVIIALTLDPIPGDELLAALGIFVPILASGAAMLEDISTVLSGREQELICALFEGHNSQESEQKFEQAFNDFWDEDIGFTPYGYSAKFGMSYMIGPAVTNKLYELQTDRNLPEGDCSSCETCPEIELDLSERQFLASYTWPEVNTYNSVGANSDVMVGDQLNLTNPTTPDSSGIYRWDIANPDNLEFSRVYIPNQAGACCNFFFFILLENENGDIIQAFSSNGLAGEHYESAGNFDPPMVVKGVVLYVANSISQGFDWTIEQLVLTCAIE